MTYVGTLVGGNANGGNVTSFTLTWPTVAANDFALVFWSHNSTTAFNAETTKPSGFTAVDSQTDGNELLGLWSKVCTGSESGTITFNVSGGTARTSAVLVVVRGYSGIHLNTKAADTGTDANHTAPSATPTIADVGVLIANGERVTTGSTSMTPPAGYTVAQQFGTGGTAGYYTGVAYEGSAGSITGTHAVSVAISPGTMVNNVSASDVAVMTVLLTPAITTRTLTPAPTTNVGVALSRQKSRTVTVTTETDAGKTSLPRRKSKSLVSADETDAPVALAGRKAKSLTPATEADAAVALTKTDPIWGTSAGATETDTAVTLVRAHARSLTAATEVDAAATGYGEGGYGDGGYGGELVRRHRRTLARGLETDDAQPLTVRKARSLTPADESDDATPLVGGTSAGPITASLIPADEADGTSVLDSRKTKSITFAVEADAGAGLARLKARTTTPAVETDAGVPLEVPTRLSVQPADETDTAPPVHRVKVRSITAATEAGATASLTATHRRTLVVVAEADVTVALTRLHTHGITAATETDEAFLLTVYDPNIPGRIISTRLRIRTAHGELSIPAAAGNLRTAESNGDLRTPAANSDLRILTAVGELR